MSTDNKLRFVVKDYWPWDQGQRGWTCPKCGTVYSPYVNTCFGCSNPPIQPNPSSPWVKPVTPYTGPNDPNPDFYWDKDESGWWTHPPVTHSKECDWDKPIWGGPSNY